MTDKCYKVEFTAHIHRLSLALKMSCDIHVKWSRGEKISESAKVPLQSGEAIFNKKISIACNMIYNTKSKIFKEKITKLSVILSSEKGTKQAGEIHFDVAEYINEKQLTKKDYEHKLEGCPDRNAKLSFSLTGVLKEEVGMDAISQSSYVNVQNQQPEGSVVFGKESSMMSKKSMMVPTKDSDKNEKSKSPMEKTQTVSGDKDEKLRELENENEKMRKQLKKIEELKSSNEQLRKKIKSENYQKAIEAKEKIENYKEQIEKMKAEIRANKKIEDETSRTMDDILKCKVKIMKAFNFLDQYGGSQLVDAVQNYLGMSCD